MKKFAVIASSLVLAGTLSALAAPAASATTYQPWTIRSNNQGLVRAWAGICGGTGLPGSTTSYPCGKSDAAQNDGYVFPRTTDWDVLTWDTNRYCLEYKLNNAERRTDCAGLPRSSKASNVGMHKVATNQRLEVRLVTR